MRVIDLRKEEMINDAFIVNQILVNEQENDEGFVLLISPKQSKDVMKIDASIVLEEIGYEKEKIRLWGMVYGKVILMEND